MQMNATQRATLKAHILANSDQTIVDALAIRNDVAIAAWYNEPTAFVVWRTNLTKEQLRAAAIAGSSEMDNLEAGKRDSLFWMLTDAVNPSDPNVRAAFQDYTANRTGGFVATALRNSLTAAAKRNASRVEQLFATGTGTSGSPGTLAYADAANGIYAEGRLDYNTVSDLLNAA